MPGPASSTPDGCRPQTCSASYHPTVDKPGRHVQADASRVYPQILDLDALDHLELIAEAVGSQL